MKKNLTDRVVEFLKDAIFPNEPCKTKEKCGICTRSITARKLIKEMKGYKFGKTK